LLAIYPDSLNPFLGSYHRGSPFYSHVQFHQSYQHFALQTHRTLVRCARLAVGSHTVWASTPAASSWLRPVPHMGAEHHHHHAFPNDRNSVLLSESILFCRSLFLHLADTINFRPCCATLKTTPHSNPYPNPISQHHTYTLCQMTRRYRPTTIFHGLVPNQGRPPTMSRPQKHLQYSSAGHS
jgi:hypothetical protein